MHDSLQRFLPTQFCIIFISGSKKSKNLSGPGILQLVHGHQYRYCCHDARTQVHVYSPSGSIQLPVLLHTCTRVVLYSCALEYVHVYRYVLGVQYTGVLQYTCSPRVLSCKLYCNSLASIHMYRYTCTTRVHTRVFCNTKARVQRVPMVTYSIGTRVPRVPTYKLSILQYAILQY